jgi:N-dimethylarginine dimethylaminohydrolase
MCPPDYFTVDYVINPWMAGNEDSLSLELAKEQWQQLYATVAQFADIVMLEPDPKLPDMVFTANAGVVYGDKDGATARRADLQAVVPRKRF